MRKIQILAVLLFLQITTLSANWEHIFGGNGRIANTIDFKGDTVYCGLWCVVPIPKGATHHGEYHYSTDFGKTWKSCLNLPSKPIELSYRINDLVFFQAWGGMRRMEGCDNSSKIIEYPVYYTTKLPFYFIKGKLYFIQNSYSLNLVSDDLGLNWYDVPAIYPDSAFRVLDYNDGLFYISAAGKIYTSDDVCESWKEYNFPFDATNIIGMKKTNNLMVFYTSNGLLFFSSDNGANWKLQNENNPILKITDFILGPDYMISSTERNGLLVSENFGINWVSKGLDNKFIKQIEIKQGFLFAVCGTEGLFGAPLSDIGILAVKENQMNNTLSIHPNPAYDVLKIAIGNPNFNISKFKIFDITGRQHIYIDNPLTDGFEIKVDINCLDSGNYYVVITSGNDLLTYPFVKI